MILADTDVLIDYLADISPVANQVFQYLAADQLWTTAITCFELLSGAAEGKRGDNVRKLVDSLYILPLDQPAAQLAATVRRQLDRSGRAIGMPDSLIAGIALLHDLPLLTRNRDHFERLPGLNVVEIEAGRPRKR